VPLAHVVYHTAYCQIYKNSSLGETSSRKASCDWEAAFEGKQLILLSLFNKDYLDDLVVRIIGFILPSFLLGISPHTICAGEFSLFTDNY